MTGRRIVVLGPVEVERIPNLPTLVEDLDGEVRVIRGDRPMTVAEAEAREAQR